MATGRSEPAGPGTAQLDLCLANYRRGKDNAAPARQGYTGGRGSIIYRRGIPSIIYWRVSFEESLGNIGESR
jgi:hypothetical protein